MQTHFLKEMIGVIRAEGRRKTSLLTDKDPDFAFDQWEFVDAPFLNELCLMLLVTLWHQVHRELDKLAARVTIDGKGIKKSQQQKQKRSRDSGPWAKWSDKLSNLDSYTEFKHMKALRLLANSYKHDPSKEPESDLLVLLNLETRVNYAPLPESKSLQKGLADFVKLGKDADYCDIAEKFVDIASDFLADVRKRAKVSPVKLGRVSLGPRSFAR